MPISIGAIIREQAESKGHTQASLGKLINLHEKTVAGIYRRETMDTALLLKISGALNYDFFQHYYKEEPLKSLRDAEMEKLHGELRQLKKENADKDEYIETLKVLIEVQKKNFELREERARYLKPDEVDKNESSDEDNAKPARPVKNYKKPK